MVVLIESVAPLLADLVAVAAVVARWFVIVVGVVVLSGVVAQVLVKVEVHVVHVASDAGAALV